MKKFLISILCITPLLYSGGKQAFQQNLQKAINDYPILMQKNSIPYQKALTWVPESGVRGKYYALKSLVGIQTLEKLSGLSVFRDGPHSSDLHFEAKNKFGYYNRPFLIYLKGHLQQILQDSSYQKIAGRIYAAHFKKLLRSYYLAYHYYRSFPNKGQIQAKYQQKMQNFYSCKKKPNYLCDPSYYVNSQLGNFTDRMDKAGYDFYESDTAPSFWVRRSIDGTADLFYEMILMALKSYDSAFLYQ